MSRLRCAALAAAVLGAAGSPRPPGEIERVIDVPRPGKVVLTLDSDVYDAARADLADLRVVDEAGQEIPFLLERAGGEAAEELRPARVLNRRAGPGQAVTVVLDFGQPFLKRELALSLSGDRFQRRVVVEGRYRFEQEWDLLADRFVFAAPDPPAERYETVPLTESNQPFLRVTVHGSPGDAAPAEVLEAGARPHARRRSREAALTPVLKREMDAAARQTVLTLDLGGRHQPYVAVVLDAANPEFWRGVTVEAWDQGHPGATSAWRPAGRGALYRVSDDEGTHEGLRLDVPGRGRLLRVRLHDGDQPPLDLGEVGVRVPLERLVFEAEAGHRYRLSYGRGDRRAPSFEVQRTVGDPVVWIAQAVEGYLGPPHRHTPLLAKLPLWRHPLVWAAGGFLVVMVSALAARRRLRRPRRASLNLAPPRRRC